MIADAVRWAGDRSLLLEFGTLEHAMSAHAHLIEHPLPGQLDAIAGARTVLVRLGGHTHAARARRALATLEFPLHETSSEREVIIDVVYDGPDLGDAAAFLDMSPEALVAWHTGQSWLGAFPGFAGFTYCVTRERALLMPRRTSPRTVVPGGSVALAGEFSGVYPRTSPGGWQLIGRTDAVMWDLDRETPSLIQPWDTVRYRQVTADAIAVQGEVGDPHPREETGPDASIGTAALRVERPGLQSLIEDFGREGAASLGAGLAGVMDRAAARDANHAVGNRANAPVIENLFGGFRATALREIVIAVAGADCEIAITTADGAARRVSSGSPFVLLPDETMEIGAPDRGARAVIALRGGIAADPVLGSVSTDTLVKLGPPPIAAGDLIATADAAIGAVQPALETARRDPAAGREAARAASRPDATTLRVVFGPRDFWFPPEEHARLSAQRWIVSPDSNRIGIRFTTDPADPDSRPLERSRTGELLSEGMAIGSLQVPPSGTPVLLANDQGITGGYPIIAVVVAEDLSLAAQLAPGSAVLFAPVNPDTLQPLEPRAADSNSDARHAGAPSS